MGRGTEESRLPKVGFPDEKLIKNRIPEVLSDGTQETVPAVARAHILAPDTVRDAALAQCGCHLGEMF